MFKSDKSLSEFSADGLALTLHRQPVRNVSTFRENEALDWRRPAGVSSVSTVHSQNSLHRLVSRTRSLMKTINIL